MIARRHAPQHPTTCGLDSAASRVNKESALVATSPVPSTPSPGSDRAAAQLRPLRARPREPRTVASFGGSATTLAAVDPHQLPADVPTLALRRRIARFEVLAQAVARSHTHIAEATAVPDSIF